MTDDDTPHLGRRQRVVLKWLANITVWDPATQKGSAPSVKATGEVLASLVARGLVEHTDTGAMVPGGGFVWGYRITDRGRELAAQL